MSDPGPDREILARVAAYYSGKLAEHGTTPRGVDWNGRDSHRLRHRQFLRLIDDPEASVLDLGCGFGDFLPFLRETGHRGPFTGYDITADMIAAARRIHGEGGNRRWAVGAVPAEAADFAVASGVLNVKGEVAAAVWEEHVRATIGVLAAASRRGFGFNILSLSSDPERRRGDLHYADPADMLRWCLARFGRSVALLQDYGLYEFTVLVRHAPAAEKPAP